MEEQHGFRSGRSTAICNLVFTNYVGILHLSNRTCKLISSIPTLPNRKIILNILELFGFDNTLLS